MLSVVLLSGCSSLPTNLSPISVNQVSEASIWEMTGKLAITAPNDKLSSNLYWLHTTSSDELTLTTMLGIRILSLTQKNGKARLTIDGKTYEDNNAQALLLNVTGWAIPIDALPLWITGQPSPSDIVNIQDNQHRPINITTTQAVPPWSINYLSWQQQNGTELPRLLTLNSDDIKIKIQINQWQALAPSNTYTDNPSSLHQMTHAEKIP
ncbi:lipoprotein insertase outer membrane protein LolB [Shewanella surugensis]